MKKLWVFCALMTVLNFSLIADITQGGHGSRALTADEWKTLCDAINCLKDIDDDALMGLNCMKGDDPATAQICIETKLTDAFAWTWTDGVKGKSEGDGININPSLLKEDKEIIAAAMAHEWVHVKTLVNNELPDNAVPVDPQQTEDHKAKGDAWKKRKAAEQPGKDKEVEVLTVFKGRASGDKKKRICARIDLLNEWMNGLCYNVAWEANCTPPPRKPGMTYRCIAKAKTSADGSSSSYYTTESEDGPDFHIVHNDNGVYNEVSYRLPFPIVQSGMGVCLAGDLTYMVISGVSLSGDTSYLLTVLCDQRDVVNVVSFVTLPAVSMSHFAHDPLSNNIYILDESANAVYVMYDSNGDTLADTVSPTPFATAVDFPFLTNTASLMVFEEDGGGLRVSSVVPTGAFPPGDVQYILSDSDGDGVADVDTSIQYREGLFFVPGFLGRCATGETEVEVYGPWGVEVFLRIIGTDELVGSGIIDSEDLERGLYNYATLPLTRPMRQGEKLEIFIEEFNNLEMVPHSVLVDDGHLSPAERRLHTLLD